MRARLFAAEEIAVYERFLDKFPQAALTQSSAWAAFQKSVRGNSWRLAVEDDSSAVRAACLLVRHDLPRGYCWFYSQGGPIGDYEAADWPAVFAVLQKGVMELAREQKAIFWRIGAEGLPSATKQISGWRRAHASYQPEETLVLDLEGSESEILAQMKPKGRYNIRLAEKKGVTVRFSAGESGDLERFYRLLEKTARRDGFFTHDFEYYRQMLKTLAPTGNARLALAEAGPDLLAAAIFTCYGEIGTYYYGSSNYEQRHLMAPYLLQWEMIRAAKRQGLKHYDFLGIAPEGAAAAHPWCGVTDFKLKFGGRRQKIPPEQELVFKPWVYRTLIAAKKIRHRCSFLPFF